MSNASDEMSFLDHLEELRWHLIRSTMAIVIVASVAFIAKDFIFDTILFGPKKLIFSLIDYFVNSLNPWDKAIAFA